MIKKLRWRLVCLTMSLLFLVMVGIIGMFIGFTGQGMKKDSLAALKNAGDWYGIHETHEPEAESEGKKPKKDRPARDKKEDDINPEESDKMEKPPERGDFLKDKTGDLPQAVIPCFVVGFDHEGQIYAEGPGYYDLSDTEKLKSLVEQAKETGENNGLLWEQKLRFLRLDDVCGDAYAFTDVTSELASLGRLIHKSVLIALLAMVGFFLICILISRWATRPVAQVMAQQRQFVADASHELKTPLTVILTNAEMLDEEVYEKTDRERSARSILTMSRQMRGLVDELLELARVEDGMPQGQAARVNLSQLVEEQVLLFEPLYFEEGRELQSQIEEALYVSGDGACLAQVMGILLDNGCKYSQPGSTVVLQLKRQGLKKCLLRVESRGQTLTHQECQDIFKRFYRRDPNRSMNHSYGLGLSIAQTVVSRHKGRIWATGKDGVNTFFVQLPLH